MATKVLDVDDLRRFKEEVKELITQLLQEHKATPISIKWLRAVEVKKRYQISTGMLHNLRASGVIKAYKLGSIIYFKEDEIDAVLLNNRE